MFHTLTAPPIGFRKISHHCGKKLAPESNFCHRCGQQLIQYISAADYNTCTEIRTLLKESRTSYAMSIRACKTPTGNTYGHIGYDLIDPQATANKCFHLAREKERRSNLLYLSLNDRESVFGKLDYPGLTRTPTADIKPEGN